jgi:predicted enzyme related to lactoylglutathione lyase
MPAYGIEYIHLAIPADGELRARRFYGELLGLTEIRKTINPASRRGVWFQCGALQLHLGAAPDWPARPGRPILFVHDVRQVIDRVLRAGHEARFDPELLPGFRRAHIADPFGNAIELMEAVAPGPADPP